MAAKAADGALSLYSLAALDTVFIPVQSKEDRLAAWLTDQHALALGLVSTRGPRVASWHERDLSVHPFAQAPAAAPAPAKGHVRQRKLRKASGPAPAPGPPPSAPLPEPPRAPAEKPAVEGPEVEMEIERPELPSFAAVEAAARMNVTI